MGITRVLIAFWLTTTSVETQIVDSIFDKLSTGYVAKRYPKRLDSALRLVPTILTESKGDLDPFLVSLLIFWESRWDPKARGQARQEHGLMQLHGKAWGPPQMFDRTNPHDQIKAGVRWLRKAQQRCSNNLTQTLNCYGAGYCKPIRPFAKRRVRIYKRLRSKYENQTITKQRWSYYQRIIYAKN